MIVIGVSYRKINKNLASVPKDIHFYITMMKLAVNLCKRINKIQAFWYKLHKKRRLGMFVQRVTVLLKRSTKEKRYKLSLL